MVLVLSIRRLLRRHADVLNRPPEIRKSVVPVVPISKALPRASISQSTNVALTSEPVPPTMMPLRQSRARTVALRFSHGYHYRR
jgi:hypothetical protein